MYSCSINCDVSSFIYDFQSFHFFLNSAKGLSVSHFKKPAISFIDLFCFLVSTSFVSALIFVVGLLLLTLTFGGSFSHILRHKVKLFEIFLFLM